MQSCGIQERRAAQIQHDMLRPRRRGVLELLADSPGRVDVDVAERADANHVALDVHRNPKLRRSSRLPAQGPFSRTQTRHGVSGHPNTPGTTRSAELPEPPRKGWTAPL